MRWSHLLVVLLTLPLVGCGGCSCSSNARNAAQDDPGEQKPPAELPVRLRAATTQPTAGDLPPDLLAALKDDSPHVRRAAVFTVRRSGADAKTISAALTPVLKDGDQFLRVVAAEGLWEAEQNADALAVLKKVLRDGSDVRAATRAIVALGEVGPAAKDVAPDLSALLKNADTDMQILIARALARIRFADVPALAEALAVAQGKARRDGDGRAIRALEHVFAELGKDAVPPLITMMKSGDARQQKVAALAIAEVKDGTRDAVPALAALLRVRQHNTHWTALEVLAHLGADAEPALLNVLELLDDDNAETAELAAVALGNMGRPALQPLLIRLRSKKVTNDWASVALARLGKDVIPSLLDALKSEDQTVRRRAALALGGMEKPPAEVLPVLVSLVKEWTENPEADAFGLGVGVGGFAGRRRDSFTTQRLVLALSSYPDKAADLLPLLIPLLKDRSQNLRLATANALRRMGQAARPAISALREAVARAAEDGTTARAATAALLAIRLDRKEDVPILVEILKANELGSLREEAAEILGRLGPEAADAVPALLDLLATAKPDNTTVLLPLVLGRIGEAALPQIIKAARAKKKGWDRQAEALGYLGKPGRAELLRWVSDEDDELRALAALILGHTGPSLETATALINALTDLHADVRLNAADYLYFVGADARAAVPALVKRLLDPKPSVRFAAAWTLGHYGADARSAIPALLDALKDDDEDVRKAAWKALSEIGIGKDQVPALIAILEAKGPAVREAFLLLGDLGEEAKDAIPALRALRKDERYEEPVMVALWQVARDGTSATRLLDRLRSTDPNLRAQAAYFLGGRGPGAVAVVPALCDALHDQNPYVREAACNALGRIGPEARAALPDLVTLVQNDEPEAALLALIAMKAAAREAIPGLKAVAKKGPPRLQVELIEAIWKIGAEDEAITSLVALLADREACAAAARVLGEIGPAAKTALPALRTQRANPERTLREGATMDEALRKIERK